MIWRDSVIERAWEWHGTPYHHKGRIKGVGVDCGGFLYEVFSIFIKGCKPFPAQYAQDWALHNNDELYLNFIEPYFNEIEPIDIKEADVKVLQIGLAYSHGMIFVGGDQYLHAWGQTGRGGVIRSNERTVLLSAKQKLQFQKGFSLKEQFRNG